MIIANENEMIFKEGDLTQLLSGGPKMNVERIEDKVIVCIWFDKNDNLKSDSFLAKNLVKIKPNSTI